jgi:selenocysteine lyase/cysteine desulfurase
MTEIAAAGLTESEAAQYRAEFPVFDHAVYLNNCSLGPLSMRSIRALEQYREDWSRYGAPAWWKVWLPKLDAAKQRFARLIGAADHEVTISHSISSALSSVASTFDYRRRPAVVCTDLEFPTVPYQWLAKSREGVSVRFARSQDRIRVTLDAYAEQMDDQVALVATSHVFYTSGYIQPIRQLADLAHSRGAKLLVDGYHSVGCFPIDVKALDVDFYLGGTLKWLLGGPGLTFIYVREELIPELHPSVTGWFSSADQFAFDALHLEWPDTADRLELGTPSVATAYSGVAGMDMVLEANPERIWARLQHLTDRIVKRAHQDGYTVVSPEDGVERGGIVMLGLDSPQETVAKLAERGFIVDYRPGLLRVSPHYFNTTQDVDGVMDALAEIQGRYR